MISFDAPAQIPTKGLKNVTRKLVKNERHAFSDEHQSIMPVSMSMQSTGVQRPPSARMAEDAARLRARAAKHGLNPGPGTCALPLGGMRLRQEAT